MKRYFLALYLAAFSATIGAQEADPCAGLAGSALAQCQGNLQKLQRQQLAEQQRQLAQQQQQLAQQQQQLAQQQQQMTQQQQQLARQQQQLAQQQLMRQQQTVQNPPDERPQNQRQLEDMQHRIDVLSTQVEHQKSANQPVTPAARAEKRREVQNWKADKPWYGSDYARTQFAMRYAKQLQQEQPDLVGRAFLDAISAKVTDKFDAGK
jgi:septal ring factor EnvC (AmiA/AmiB activator)